MSKRQPTTDAGSPVDLDVGASRATLRMEDPRVSARFRVHRADQLTVARVEGEILPKLDQDSLPLLVTFERASQEARAMLRERRISYAADDGEWFIYAPPIFVERPHGRRPRSLAPRQPGPRNPFARTSSRVLRWLLLHPDQRFSVRELARTVQLSDALTSRVVRSLEEAAWIEVSSDPCDGRTKLVSMRRPSAALEAWARAWESRRVPAVAWDIGTRGPDQTLRTWKEAAKANPDLDWAVSGLAGAALIRRAVEPADALIWVRDEEVERWAEELLPTAVPRGDAQLRLAVAPDPFVFELVSELDGLRVADAVQLWLDCRMSGERALEAADAIRQEMGW